MTNMYDKQSCLTFPTGTAQTQSKHHSMRDWKGMNSPYLQFCGWELDFWEVKPRTVLVECPFSHEILRLLSSFSQAMWTKPNVCLR